MSDTGGEDIRVQLTRIEGGVTLLNERHDNIKVEIRDIREQQHRHSNRLGILEADKHLREGKQQGLATGGKWLWAAVGFLPGAALALAKLFGL